MKKYENFHSHLMVLNRAHEQDLQNEFIVSGIIDKFFIQFELGWKVLKELLNYEGDSRGVSGSPREIIKATYYYFDFIDEAVWLGMLRDRNDCTHIYNQDMAQALVRKIIEVYIPAYNVMDKAIVKRYGSLLKKD